MSPFPLLRFLSCFASAEGQLEGLTGAIRSFWSNLCKANKMLCLCRTTRLGKATKTFGMKPELGHFPQNCVILITVLCDIWPGLSRSLHPHRSGPSDSSVPQGNLLL